MSSSEQKAGSLILAWAFPALIAAALCSLLATYPLASIRPAQPYKVEIFLSLCGIIMGLWLLKRCRHNALQSQLRLNAPTIGVVLFTVFSLASALWAGSTD
jgi:hypothetical protein